MSFSISQSSLKPFELKSVFSGLWGNNNIRAVSPSSLTFPPTYCTNSTAQSYFSNCGLQEYKYIDTAQLSLSIKSRCLYSSSWNRLQLKSKSSSFSYLNSYIRLHNPLSSFISPSTSINKSTHLEFSSRKRG